MQEMSVLEVAEVAGGYPQTDIPQTDYTHRAA